jgi:endonuclease-8
MDHRVVAGIGNVSRSELLSRAGLDPRRPALELSADQLSALWNDAVALLRLGERLGRIVTVDPLDLGDAAGGPPDWPATSGHERLYVYRRPSCRRCGAPVDRMELDGRRAYACRREQLAG